MVRSSARDDLVCELHHAKHFAAGRSGPPHPEKRMANDSSRRASLEQASNMLNTLRFCNRGILSACVALYDHPCCSGIIASNG